MRCIETCAGLPPVLLNVPTSSSSVSAFASPPTNPPPCTNTYWPSDAAGGSTLNTCDVTIVKLTSTGAAAIDRQLQRAEVDDRRRPRHVDIAALQVQHRGAPLAIDERLALHDDLRARNDRAGRDIRQRQPLEARVGSRRARAAGEGP